MKIGCGTWPMGGQAYGPVSKVDAIETIIATFGAGIRLYDTADIYGDGRSETLLGKLFHNRNDIKIITKAGYIREHSREQNFAPDHIINALLNSLKRLQRDHVHSFLFHSPPLDVLESGELQDIGTQILEAGLANHIGVSLAHIDHYPALEDWKQCHAVELIYNLLDQRALDRGILADAAQKGRAVYARLPLASGFLGGHMHSGIAFSKNDSRSRWPHEQVNAWLSAAEAFHNIKPSMPLAKLALAFIMSTPGITAVIPGFKKPDHVSLVTALDHMPPLAKPIFKAIRDLWLDQYQNLPPA